MRRVLLNKKGVGVIEALLVAVIMGLLMGAVFYLLNVVQSSRAVSTVKIEVQSEARRCMDWIVNDVRQTVNWSIGSKDNSPSSSYIKFKKVTGYSTAGSGSTIMGDFIEYSYDSITSTITRTDLATNQSWVFRYIVQPPFYTRLSDGSIVVIDPVSVGNDSPVFTTGNLVIVIVGQKPVSGATNIDYTLTEEVKIRN